VSVLVACHQPNFLPWLGFFDKLAQADRFVLLDDVQFPRTSRGTYTNRVQLLVGGQPAWLTVPVVREGVQRIGEVRIDDRQPWRRKALRTIEQTYARAPGFAQTMPIVRELLELETDRIAALNEHAIRRLAPQHAAKLVRQSDLEPVDGAATDLLIGLVKAAGGDAYLSGDGADGYQDEPRYAAVGLGFRLQGFRHPDTGVPPGLSIVDALMRGALPVPPARH
jgi:WbqC-like protein family